MTWEDAVEEAQEYKSLKYAELVADAEQSAWKARFCPFQAGGRGLEGKSTIKLMKDMGVQGKAHW